MRSRREQAGPPWVAGMQAAQAEGGGAMRLYVFAPTDMGVLLGAVMLGDVEAIRLMRGVANTISRIERAPRRRPMLCGSCPAPLKSPAFCVGLALPECDDPTSSIGFAFCLTCAKGAVSLPELAAPTLRRIWPESRLVTITDPVGGHA